MSIFDLIAISGNVLPYLNEGRVRKVLNANSGYCSAVGYSFAICMFAPHFAVEIYRPIACVLPSFVRSRVFD